MTVLFSWMEIFVYATEKIFAFFLFRSDFMIAGLSVSILTSSKLSRSYELLI